MKVLCSGELYDEPIETDMCLSCSLRHNRPPCGFSYPLLKALFYSQEEERRKDEIHVSDLNGCLLKAYYSKVDPAPTYVHDKLVLMMGVAVHEYIERAVADDPHMKSEVPISDVGIDGRIDVLTEGGDILDIKTTRWLDPWKGLPYGSHEDQVNAYRALAEVDGELAIQYVDMSGPPRCRKCGILMVMIDGIVQCPVCGNTDRRNHLGAIVVPVDIQDKEEVREKLGERQKLLASALKNNVPPDPEPGWLCQYCSYLDRCSVGSIYVEAK